MLLTTVRAYKFTYLLIPPTTDSYTTTNVAELSDAEMRQGHHHFPSHARKAETNTLLFYLLRYWS